MLCKLKDPWDNTIDIIFDISVETIHLLESWLDDNIFDSRLSLNDPASCYIIIYPFPDDTDILYFNICIEGEHDNITFNLEPVEIISF